MNNLLKIATALLLSAWVYSCATKTGTQTQSTGYSEDLSLYRPLYPDPAPDSVSIEVADHEEVKFREPQLAITAKLDTLLDSIASYSRSRGFYQILVIQIYTGTSNTEANDAKATAYKEFPDMTPTLEYVQPIFKVKIGKFYERLDAQRTLREVRRIFPGAILIPERVYN